MAWTTNPYCQLADVKNALALTTTQDDSWLSQLIVQAQAYLDKEIGFPFQTDGTVTVPASRVYSGNNMNQLYIDDCIQVTQVLEYNYNLIIGSNGMWTQANPTTLDITADVVLGPDNLPLGDYPAYMAYRLSGLPFQRGRQNYKFYGVFGRPTIPAPITRACIRLVAHWYKMRETNYADGLAQMQGGHEVYHKQCPPDVCEIITMYRRKIFLAR